MIHVFYTPGEGHEVWIDSEDGDKDGICLGSDKSRDEAINQARSELNRHLEDLEDHAKDSEPDYLEE